ncbi:putative disease resistance RPP13 protein 1 [Spatholobus suberectus]|nr:putative disease resistance RPP13 protein 1 [Spatholobus suberectus]
MLPSGMQNLVNLRHLEIDGTSIQEMPAAMGKLNHLQHLDFFIVGKDEESEIKELGGLSNLHGSLSIRNLENVVKSDNALEARIMDKKHINSLSLQWSGCYNSASSHFEIDLLCNLQPHLDLKSLSIHGYKGTRFPDWVGNVSYHNMTHLSLSNCDNCCMLPSLGQLPSLKDLDISKLNMVEIIDAGFYRKEDCSSVTSFPSLEFLKIYDMPCWEVWSSVESDAFPLLKRLVIRGCPKLRGDLPNHLPVLESLTVEDCKLLVSSLPRAPTIRRLEISKSNKVALHVLPLSVESMEIKESPMVVESMIEAITNIEPTCLRSLTLCHCSSAISFPSGRLPASLKTLKICSLKKLEFPTQHKHELLQSLSIWDCDSLTSLPLATFPNLKSLEISYCKNMESLLVSGSESPKNLSSFKICNCPNLKSLPDQMSTLFPKLENLEIYKCPEIESFPEGGMPPNLRKIVICNCEKLLTGLAWPSMAMLTSLSVGGPCDGIKSFPKEGLLPPSLSSLRIFGFLSLETLNCKGLLHLTSLQKLEIDHCQQLENMEREKLPVSLIKLSIRECPLLQNDAHEAPSNLA